MVSIYSLSDPRSGAVRYIGKTNNNLTTRLTGHIKDVKRCSHKNAQWINGLLKHGLKPIIDLVDTVPEENWQEEESFYINYFKYLGFNLLNMTDGGESGTGRVLKDDPYFFRKQLKDNPEWEEKRKTACSNYHLGSRRTKEQIEATRQKNFGRKMSLNHKEFLISLSKSRTGKRNYAAGRPIIQFDENGLFIKDHSSIRKACTDTNCGKTSIYRSLRANKESLVHKTSGFYFKNKYIF